METDPPLPLHGASNLHPNQIMHQNKMRSSTSTRKFHCDVCNKDLTGEVTMEAHLRGVKHARTVKSKEILEKLKEEGRAPLDSADPHSAYRCEICDIVLNSTHSMALHVNGQKHKTTEKEAAEKNPGVVASIVKIASNERAQVLKAAMEASIAAKATKKATRPSDSTSMDTGDGAATVSEPATPAQNTETPAARGEQPTPSQTTKSEEPAKKAPKVAQTFECTTCHVSLNSEMQRDQHMKSKKHADRAAGITVARGRGFGTGFRQARGGGYNSVGGGDAPYSGGSPRGSVTPRAGRGGTRGGQFSSGGRASFTRGGRGTPRGAGSYSARGAASDSFVGRGGRGAGNYFGSPAGQTSNQYNDNSQSVANMNWTWENPENGHSYSQQDTYSDQNSAYGVTSSNGQSGLTDRPYGASTGDQYSITGALQFPPASQQQYNPASAQLGLDRAQRGAATAGFGGVTGGRGAAHGAPVAAAYSGWPPETAWSTQG